MEQYTSYLTYDDYKELGGTLPQDAFARYERKAQRWLDHITYDRIKYMKVIPNEVRELLVEFISRMVAYEGQKKDGDTIKAYSNGVESFTYELKTEKQTQAEFRDLALTWLPDYLTNRLVKFDVREYLQSIGNYTEQT